MNHAVFNPTASLDVMLSARAWACPALLEAWPPRRTIAAGLPGMPEAPVDSGEVPRLPPRESGPCSPERSQSRRSSGHRCGC